jgi:V/A-type H+-transporting ATPase subunit I
MIKGWIPEKAALKAKEMLEAKYTVSVDIEEPPLTKSFRFISKTADLRRPASLCPICTACPIAGEIDPNVVMTPFFVMFFGLMLSDGGYGIIMVLVAALALWGLKLDEGKRKFMKLIFFCGLSTIFWASCSEAGLASNRLPDTAYGSTR